MRRLATLGRDRRPRSTWSPGPTGLYVPELPSSNRARRVRLPACAYRELTSLHTNLHKEYDDKYANDLDSLVLSLKGNARDAQRPVRCSPDRENRWCPPQVTENHDIHDWHRYQSQKDTPPDTGGYARSS